MPAWEDLGVFLNTDDFAVRAIVRFHDNRLPAKTVSVIFDEPYMNAERGEYDMDTTDPRVTGKWSDLREVLRGDTVEIDGRVFDVLTNAQPDGTGIGVLRMAEQ